MIKRYTLHDKQPDRDRDSFGGSMMKRFFLGFLFPLLFAAGSWANLRIEVVDLAKRAVKITYEFNDTKVGNKVFIFPAGGFIHDATAGDFKVESVFDVAAKRELEYVLVSDPKTKLPQLKITHETPIQKDESRTLQVTVKANLPESMVQRDANGRYIFEYETSHKFEFLLPQNHYVVYSNQPVWLFEKGDQIVVQQLDEKSRTIIIQTRPMK